MKSRIISVWVAVLSAGAVAVICHCIAGEAGRPILHHGRDLPLLSRVFYPDALLIYFYPLPLGLLALFFTTGGRENTEKSLLLITITLCVTMIFIVSFILGIALPYIPGTPVVMP